MQEITDLRRMSAARLKVTGLSKRYGVAATPVPVLQDFNMNVGSGEFVSLFGPNGCGKSTLLHLIAGIIEPDAGKVEFNVEGRQNCSVGMVFQDYEKSLMPWRTCLDNIALPLERRQDLSRANIKLMAREVEEKLGLDLPFDRFPYELSGGQKQLTCVARAMATSPSLLLLDEPFASLDYQSRLNAQMKLQEVWQRTRVTTLLVSHEIDEAIFLADRVLLLSDRPAKVAGIFQVPFTRPRPLSTFSSAAFAALRGAVLDQFTKEMST